MPKKNPWRKKFNALRARTSEQMDSLANAAISHARRVQYAEAENARLAVLLGNAHALLTAQAEHLDLLGKPDSARLLRMHAATMDARPVTNAEEAKR